MAFPVEIALSLVLGIGRCRPRSANIGDCIWSDLNSEWTLITVPLIIRQRLCQVLGPFEPLGMEAILLIFLLTAKDFESIRFQKSFPDCNLVIYWLRIRFAPIVPV